MSQISRTFNGGDSCTISATASAHYHFVNWTENGSEITKLNPYTFTVDSDRTITGNFAIDTHLVSASVSPSNAGSISGGGSYNYGASCTLTFTPSAGYTFSEWQDGNGKSLSRSNPWTFTLERDMTVVAVSTLNGYTISASVDPSGGGSVSGTGTYNYGATVSLTATPASGYAFVGWYEDSSRVDNRNPLTFTATRDVSLTAKFAPTYTVEVNYNNTQGTVSFIELQSEND